MEQIKFVLEAHLNQLTIKKEILASHGIYFAITSSFVGSGDNPINSLYAFLSDFLFSSYSDNFAIYTSIPYSHYISHYQLHQTLLKTSRNKSAERNRALRKESTFDKYGVLLLFRVLTCLRQPLYSPNSI